jgi:hypothetical protein
MSHHNDQSSEILARVAALTAEVPALTETLRGTVGVRHVRCGKKRCHCVDGELHGPVYYLSVSLGSGRTKQVTLTPETYELARRYSENYASLHRILEEVSALNRELFEERGRVTRRKKRAP